MCALRHSRTCIRWCRRAARLMKWFYRSQSRGERKMLQLILILLENKPGALMRVVGVLLARGDNIESFAGVRALCPELSRMSIVVDVEPSQCVQVIKQMNKLINVLEASDLTEAPAVQRELVLIRIRADQGHHSAIQKEVDIFGARIVDRSPDGFALE